jgi:ribosomal protein L44E
MSVTEHYTKNTLECTAYCRPCGRFTQHRVDSGRRGPCLECKPKGPTKKEIQRNKQRASEAQNPRLFEK